MAEQDAPHMTIRTNGTKSLCEVHRHGTNLGGFGGQHREYLVFELEATPVAGRSFTAVKCKFYDTRGAEVFSGSYNDFERVMMLGVAALKAAKGLA